jgi:hypothetical protein
MCSTIIPKAHRCFRARKYLTVDRENLVKWRDGAYVSKDVTHALIEYKESATPIDRCKYT